MRLHGAAGRIAAPAAVFSLLAALPLLWFATAGTPVPGRAPAWAWPVLAGAAALGLAGATAAAVVLMRQFWRIMTARSKGSTWAEVVAVASEPHRSMAGLALAAAAFAPLPSLLVASMLAAAGVLDRTGLWIATLAPPLLLGIVAWALVRYSGPPVPSSLSLETAGRTAALLYMTLIAVSIGFGVWLLALGSWAREIRDRVEAVSAPTSFPAEAVQRYRIPSDAGITPAMGGRALHSIMGVGAVTRPSAHLLPPADSFALPWLPDGIEKAVGVLRGAWASELIRAAGTTGLPASARAALEQAMAHPAEPLVRRAARAGSADLVSARLREPVDSRITALDIPVPDYGPLHRAAYAHVGRAALALDDGDAAAAESILREVVALGGLLYEEAWGTADAAAAHTVARIGLEGLEALYAVTGRPADAAAIRADLDSGGVPGGGRGAAWDAIGRRVVETCVRLPTLLFGPPDGFEREILERARPLVRRPSDLVWLDVVAGRPCSPLTYM